MYYSSFYLIRCDILKSNHITVRCGAFYYGKIEIGQSLIQFRKNKVRGDHQLTIALAEKLHEDGEVFDPILDNKISDMTSYTWLMKNRERVNYQMKNFSDPYSDLITAHFESYFKESKISDLLEFYARNNDYSVCFDVEHAILSIPFKKLQVIFKFIKDNLSLTDKELRKMVDLKRTLENLGVKTNDLEKCSMLLAYMLFHRVGYTTEKCATGREKSDFHGPNWQSLWQQCGILESCC